MFLTDHGCLLRKADSGENHILLALFLRETGLKYALARKFAKAQAGHLLPDLFEFGDFVIEQKDPARPAFLKDYQPALRFPEIARDYQRLKAASQLARFFERNLLHMESFASAWQLLRRTLEAIAVQPLPDAALLKALFLMARDEGYPVVSNWLHHKPEAERNAIASVLRNPLADLAGSVDPKLPETWVADLYRFLEYHTDLLPPGPGR